MQLNLKHEIIHNENKANVYCDTAYQCIIHAFGSIDLWNYRFAACSFLAEMQKDKTVMLGGNFMNKEITPPTWYYHTYNYF